VANERELEFVELREVFETLICDLGFAKEKLLQALEFCQLGRASVGNLRVRQRELCQVLESC
jgi:hypothetical protein